MVDTHRNCRFHVVQLAGTVSLVCRVDSSNCSDAESSGLSEDFIHRIFKGSLIQKCRNRGAG